MLLRKHKKNLKKSLVDIKMDKNSRIRVDKTEYVESKHIMLWSVTFVDENDDRFGKSITLAYRANDLASAFLGRDDIQVTAEGAISFNQNIEGREINLVEKFDPIIDKDISESDDENFLDYNVKFRDYPFEEVYDMLSRSD